jgi:hypothetical protein
MNKLNTEKFIQKSVLIHKDVYDYSFSDYINNKTKINILCKKHGIFEQIPMNHLAGQGCKKCKIEYFAKLKNMGCDTFAQKAKKIHGNKYDYSTVIYKNIKTPINIKCLLHGIFTQTPNSHLNGSGCPKCGKIESSKKLSVLYAQTPREFLQKANKIHNNMYDYNKSNYINNRIKIEIVCKKHGGFWQTPNSHLQREGCPKCVHKISKSETEFLNYLKIPDTQRNRQCKILKFKVDGIKNNKIFEFLGDYYHGNPRKFDSDNYNQICHKTFGELYENTINKFKLLKENNYDVYYMWEYDWNRWSKNKLVRNIFPIKKYKVGENL